MADLEKQLAELENDIIASEKPAQVAAAATTAQPAPQGGIAKYIAGATPKTMPKYFYGILAGIPILVIAILYFVKPKLIYRKKKFIVQDYVKLTLLITIALWVLTAAIMYFGGYI